VTKLGDLRVDDGDRLTLVASSPPPVITRAMVEDAKAA